MTTLMETALPIPDEPTITLDLSGRDAKMFWQLARQLLELPGSGPFVVKRRPAHGSMSFKGDTFECMPLAAALLAGQIERTQEIARYGMMLDRSFAPIDKSPVAVVFDAAQAYRENLRQAQLALHRQSIATPADADVQQVIHEEAPHFHPDEDGRPPFFRAQHPHHQPQEPSQSPLMQSPPSGSQSEPAVSYKGPQYQRSRQLPPQFHRYGVETHESLSALMTSGYAGLDDRTVLELEHLVAEFDIPHVKAPAQIERVHSAEQAVHQAALAEDDRQHALRAHPGYLAEDRPVDSLP